MSTGESLVSIAGGGANILVAAINALVVLNKLVIIASDDLRFGAFFLRGLTFGRRNVNDLLVIRDLDFVGRESDLVPGEVQTHVGLLQERGAEADMLGVRVVRHEQSAAERAILLEVVGGLEIDEGAVKVEHQGAHGNEVLAARLGLEGRQGTVAGELHCLPLVHDGRRQKLELGSTKHDIFRRRIYGGDTHRIEAVHVLGLDFFGVELHVGHG